MANKKFQFKLNGLLKLREFKEKQLKVELGQILKEIQMVKDQIAELHQFIDESYKSQEKLLRESVNGRSLGFFPKYVEVKKEDIKNRENYLYALERRYEDKVKDLTMAMGDVKVIENLKQKLETAHKKEIQKKQNEDLEEIINMRRG